MSHQVLARKWRPKAFEALVGQEHVVRALTHALDTGRLHHAYLFTGTRGVGKTTLARILAKAVNCEAGMRAQPCGRCGACLAIDQGRFADYLELDAASNRGVEDMAQLLENAVYAPVSGRFKVYVIDEVHMLSTHAFNAMLKTLEEPPSHVLFVLATTDPQKVPVTVLSRCLQFNLKNVPPRVVADHLARVLQAEAVAFEPAALLEIGRAAAGSVRDALSLLDQAIAHGAGSLRETQVRQMLGVVDRHDLRRLLEALVAADATGLVALADDMAQANAPFDRVLLELAALVQRIAAVKAGVDLRDDLLAEPGTLAVMAQAIDAETLQVYYQIAVHGARELPLAPDPACGFTMTLLRLHAFSPGRDPGPRPDGSPGSGRAQSGIRGSGVAGSGVNRTASEAAPAKAGLELPPVVSDEPAAPQPVDSAGLGTPAVAERSWTELAGRLPRSGLLGQFLQQSELIARDGEHFRLRVPIRPLAETGLVAKVREALSRELGRPVRLSVEVGVVQGETAAGLRARSQAESLARARGEIESDPFVRTLLADFGGTILPDSVRSLGSNGDSP